MEAVFSSVFRRIKAVQLGCYDGTSLIQRKSNRLFAGEWSSNQQLEVVIREFI